MRGTRHNGRSGVNGIYNPKHNDREFDVDNAVDINEEMTPYNIYWNCYQGFTFHKDKSDDWMAFSEVELRFYKEYFSDWLDTQNERHIKGGHRKRVKTMENILASKRWCPEETIYQIGNIEGTIDYNDLATIVAETMKKINERFGNYVKTMDWGLHVDEKTPHIHERHVFFAPDEYGFKMPQQEEACRMMGLALPDDEDEKGRYNNRKMTFDAQCRSIFLETCKEHGIELEVEPIYGGKKYQEKTEFINSQINMKNQKLTIENGKLLLENSNLLDQKMSLSNDIIILNDEKTKKEIELADVEAFINDVTEIVYDKACETIADEMAESMKKESVKEIGRIKKETMDSDGIITKMFGRVLADIFASIQKRMDDVKERVSSGMKAKYSSADKKRKLLARIVEESKPSLMEILRKENEVIREKTNRSIDVPKKKKRNEISL